MNPISNHNDFYLTEDRRHEPREFFKSLRAFAARRLAANPTARVLDVGCANGEFLYFLRSSYPAIQVVGIDVNAPVIEKARELLPNGEFAVADIESGENLPSGKFDLVFMNGVHYLLRDYHRWLQNLIALSRGAVFVFGVFNPEDLDFRATVSRPGEHQSVSHWNLISQKSIKIFLDGLPTSLHHRFHNWEMPIDSPRSHADPMRCWTIRTEDGRRLQVNGLQIVHQLAILEIEVDTSDMRHANRVLRNSNRRVDISEENEN
jgi:SAM-dependent methyltransferase